MRAAPSSGTARRPGLALVWTLCACIGVAGANSRAEESDPAGRVTRISYLKSLVYVQTAEDNAWSDASLNQPLTSGDRLWTDAQGRSELQMGNTIIQVGANTQLRLSELNDQVLQLEVTQGVVNVHVRNQDTNDSIEIDTPNTAVTPIEPGTYRIDVPEHDDFTAVQVRSGRLRVASEMQNFTLRSGEQLGLHGTTHLTAEFDQLADMDEFDRWAQDRNDRAERAVSSRYVAADVIGHQDLDDYGNWRWHSNYGYVWMPTRIAAGWAPYRYGRWSWVSPWGWTWMDDAPWGFAPFHYGRWAMLHSRWCWVPGPRTTRAMYAPAMVVWIGTPGRHVAINTGHQPIGWIPLGPREVYRPYYRGSHHYVTRMNMSNTLLNRGELERGFRRQPHHNDYQNRAAASVVQADTLRAVQPVNKYLIRPDRALMQPLTSQPVARPDHHEAINRARQWSPPLLPNTRHVLSRRQSEMHEASNRDASRSKGNTNNPEPGRWHRSQDANDAMSTGRSIDSGSNDSRITNERDHGFPRAQPTDRNNGSKAAAADRNSHSITPFAHPANAPARRYYDPSTNSPTVPAVNAAPDTTPRIRSQPWVRDETPLGRGETSDLPSDRHAAPRNRERTITVPHDPAPMRSAPASRQAAPTTQPSPRAIRPGSQ